MKLTVLLSIFVFLVLVWITSKEPTVVIVTSHWKEDLNWLKKSKYPVVLIDHEGSDPPAIEPTTIIPNRGNESSSYIRYIIDNWDSLPDYVAFIHGHETSHHQKHKEHMLTLIDRARRSRFCNPERNVVRRTVSFMCKVRLLFTDCKVLVSF